MLQAQGWNKKFTRHRRVNNLETTSMKPYDSIQKAKARTLNIYIPTHSKLQPGDLRLPSVVVASIGCITPLSMQFSPHSGKHQASHLMWPVSSHIILSDSRMLDLIKLVDPIEHIRNGRNFRAETHQWRGSSWLVVKKKKKIRVALVWGVVERRVDCG